MTRRANGLLAAVFVLGSGVAWAGGKHEKWTAVEWLGIGVRVEVDTKAGLEDCRVVSVDDAALTCEREPDPDTSWDAGSKARVVFPREAVRAVWVWEKIPEPHIGLWIGGAIGFALGGAVCSVGGPWAIVGCGFVGALIGAGIAAAVEAGPAPYPPVWSPFPMPTGVPRRQPEWRRKLCYRRPVSRPASPASSLVSP